MYPGAHSCQFMHYCHSDTPPQPPNAPITTANSNVISVHFNRMGRSDIIEKLVQINSYPQFYEY